MKRTLFIISFLLICASAFCQTFTSDMGKRLTRWTLSSDGRRARTYQILQDLYPGESSATLERRIDNFANNTDDTRKVLLAIYSFGGADYGYTAIKDYFTKQQITVIEQAYVASGGTIEKERTEAERKRQSELAGKRGITKDMARSLTAFCSQNTNMRFLANDVLISKGVSTFACSRVIDSFEDNLDYVEAVLFALYDREGGTERAYHSLRLFLTSSQIQVTDALYEKRDAQRRAERKRVISSFAEPILAKEPYALPEETVNAIADHAKHCANSELRKYPAKNYTLTVKDSLFTYSGSNSGYHKINISLTPDIDRYRVNIFFQIDAIPIKPLSFYSSELNYTCYPACQGYYEFEITRAEYEYSFYVEHKKLKSKEVEAAKTLINEKGQDYMYDYMNALSERRRNYPADCLIDSIVPLSALTLITGDEEGFAKVIEPLTNYLYNKNKFGKQKVKVLLVTINGEFEHIEITLLDKNAVIE